MSKKRKKNILVKHHHVLVFCRAAYTLQRANPWHNTGGAEAFHSNKALRSDLVIDVLKVLKIACKEDKVLHAKVLFVMLNTDADSLEFWKLFQKLIGQSRLDALMVSFVTLYDRRALDDTHAYFAAPHCPVRQTTSKELEYAHFARTQTALDRIEAQGSPVVRARRKLGRRGNQQEVLNGIFQSESQHLELRNQTKQEEQIIEEPGTVVELETDRYQDRPEEFELTQAAFAD